MSKFYHHAYVLLSGGIDSSVCLFQAIENIGTVSRVTGISILYGQRHHKEVMHAKEICSYIGCRHHIVRAAEQPPSMITDEKQEIPNVAYEDLKGVSPTYAPFRNGQLLSQITAICVANLKSEEDLGYIYFGAHAEDAQNWAYPDCTPEFIGAMANAIYVGTYRQVRLVTPLMWLNKAQIILLGTSMAVPWAMTWSCYKGLEDHCGICPTCRARRDGFLNAYVQDPTKYTHAVPMEPAHEVSTPIPAE